MKGEGPLGRQPKNKKAFPPPVHPGCGRRLLVSFRNIVKGGRPGRKATFLRGRFFVRKEQRSSCSRKSAQRAVGHSRDLGKFSVVPLQRFSEGDSSNKSAEEVSAPRGEEKDYGHLMGKGHAGERELQAKERGKIRPLRRERASVRFLQRAKKGGIPNGVFF